MQIKDISDDDDDDWESAPQLTGNNESDGNHDNFLLMVMVATIPEEETKEYVSRAILRTVPNCLESIKPIKAPPKYLAPSCWFSESSAGTITTRISVNNTVSTLPCSSPDLHA